MKRINKEALLHGGKELTTKKMKELGAQAEKEAKAIFVTKTNQNGKMEQESSHLQTSNPIHLPQIPLNSGPQDLCLALV